MPLGRVSALSLPMSWHFSSEVIPLQMVMLGMQRPDAVCVGSGLRPVLVRFCRHELVMVHAQVSHNILGVGHVVDVVLPSTKNRPCCMRGTCAKHGPCRHCAKHGHEPNTAVALSVYTRGL